MRDRNDARHITTQHARAPPRSPVWALTAKGAAGGAMGGGAMGKGGTAGLTELFASQQKCAWLAPQGSRTPPAGTAPSPPLRGAPLPAFPP